MIENLKDFLDEKVEKYNQLSFIVNDPIQIPHQFTLKQDIEIAGFLTATIAWGNRKSIIKNAEKMMNLLGNSPFDFVMSHQLKDLEKLNGFVHRTFNEDDFKFFVQSLKRMYRNQKSLEDFFLISNDEIDTTSAIERFRNQFINQQNHRAKKHISSPLSNSAAKRINMFLRWMVRKDNQGVDLGIWERIPMSKLSCPLDVHSGNTARKLGLLNRKQNDQKAVKELDISLRKLDKKDPVKYDFALFGLGVFEKF